MRKVISEIHEPIDSFRWYLGLQNLPDMRLPFAKSFAGFGYDFPPNTLRNIIFGFLLVNLGRMVVATEDFNSKLFSCASGAVFFLKFQIILERNLSRERGGGGG